MSAMIETLEQLPAARLLEAFLAGRSPATLRTYSQGLEDFRLWLRVATVADAARDLLTKGGGEANRLALAYRADLIERKLAPATINLRLAALRSLAKLAATFGLVAWRVEIGNVRSEAYRDTRGPGAEAFRAIVARLVDRGDRKAKRDLALVRLLHDVALRRAEVAGLDVADFDPAAGCLLVTRKGRRERTRINLPPATLAAVRDWLAARGGEAGPLFTNLDPAGRSGRLTGTSIYRTVRALGAAIGSATRPHGLRHTGITTACEKAAAAGIPLESVLDYSGHANVRTLMVYRDKARDMQGRLAALVAGE
jgi:integrase/recombinase XerC